MAEAECLDRGYMGRLLQLTLLAPMIVDTIEGGRQRAGLDLARLMEPVPAEWERQCLPDCAGSDVVEPAHGRRSGNKCLLPGLGRPKSFPG
jgi:hypothetical protein